MRLYWKLVFEIPWTEPKLDWLLKEFRLIVNKSIRVALEQRLHSRMRLARVAYAGFGREHNIYKQYIPSAFDFALRILKTYRRRFKQGKTASVPYVRKPVLVAENQSRHFRRRRRLARAKAQDRRVQRRLLARESARERRRVKQRLHLVSKRLVQFALASKSAIVLENLKLPSLHGRSRRMNRRLSSWPNREIHRQIEYKAALRGVPVIKVNPAWTSKTCPVCGARRRDRVGKDFVCLICDWEMDRQHNAALNILKTALASNEALARAVRFQPGALRHDVVSPLYDLSAWPTGAREEPKGRSDVGVPTQTFQNPEVHRLPTEAILPHWDAAANALRGVDPEDVPDVATALSVSCDGIWSDDPHLKGQDLVPCRTTKELVGALREDGLRF